jgi:hypothetical protein
LGSAGLGLAYSSPYLNEAKFLVLIQSQNEALLVRQITDCCRYAVL